MRKSSTTPDQLLGARLRALRARQSLTLETLASQTGLTKSYLSKLERAVAAPSIATALRLAEALGVSIGQIVGADTRDEVVCMVRRNERTPFRRGAPRAGYVYEAIAARRAIKRMEPFVMRPPRTIARGNAPYHHRGEELIYVLRGKIELTLGDDRVMLAAGDSVYFDASVPHCARALSAGAEALVVVAPRD